MVSTVSAAPGVVAAAARVGSPVGERVGVPAGERVDTSVVLEAIAKEGRAAATDSIETKRQHLRDIPQTADLGAIATPEGLGAFEPQWEKV